MGKRGVKRPRQMQGLKATQPKRSMAIATPAAVAAMLHNSVGESNPTPPKHQTKNQARNGKGKRKPKQPMREPGQAIRPVREVKPVTPSSQLDLINSANPNPKRIGLYTNSHRILLVGEGDFSFGAALATAVGGNKLVATSYDGRSLVLGKYRATAPAAIAKLKRTGAVILHNIDAVELQKSLEAEWEKGLRADTSVLGTHGSHPPAFDRIVFNFPHAGGATEEDVRENRRILLGYFSSGFDLLSSCGQIHVTLRDSVFYQSWDLPGLVAEHLDDKLEFVGCKPFDVHAFRELGYGEVRTNPATREAPATENAVTYVWKVTRALSLTKQQPVVSIKENSTVVSPSDQKVSSSTPTDTSKATSLGALDEQGLKKAIKATEKSLRGIKRLTELDVRTLNFEQKRKISRRSELEEKLSSLREILHERAAVA